MKEDNYTKDPNNYAQYIKYLEKENISLKQENETLKQELNTFIANRKKAGRNPVLTEKEKEEIRKRRLQGDTITSLAKQYNCSVGTIHTIVKKRR